MDRTIAEEFAVLRALAEKLYTLGQLEHDEGVVDILEQLVEFRWKAKSETMADVRAILHTIGGTCQ